MRNTDTELGYPPIAKVLLTSDLHIDTYKFEPEKYVGHWKNFDIVCIAGDVSNNINTTREFLESCAKNFPDVELLFVPGNHCFYTTDFKSVAKMLAELEATYKNFHWLRVNKNKATTFKVGNVVFLGDTLWTDYELYPNMDLNHAMFLGLKNMNDFNWILLKPIKNKVIAGLWEERASGKYLSDLERIALMDFLHKCKGHKLYPRHIIRKHWHQRNILMKKAKRLKEKGHTVVMMTHHLPHEQSCDSRYYRYNIDMAYASHIVKEDTPVDYWFHGHTHEIQDYTIGNTRILANPNGYNVPRRENLAFELELMCS